ncbi:MAG TPA: DUF1735 domain-containing protein [Puia sp.]|jgi:hypothetical protein|nr:DUF1735 domain-containing protein [Puia sp.]
MSLKKLSIICFLPAVVVLGGCLKDTPYLDVSDTQPIIEFGQSPANGVSEPLQYDTAAPSLMTDIDTAVGLVIASPQVLSKAYTITVGVDTTQITAFNASGNNLWGGAPLSYTLMPDSLYALTASVTIPAGYRIGRLPITLFLSKLPLNTAYALPLKIVNGDGLIVSGATYPDNSGQFMWTFYRAY